MHLPGEAAAPVVYKLQSVWKIARGLLVPLVGPGISRYCGCRACAPRCESRIRAYYVNSAEVKDKRSFYLSSIFAARRRWCLKTREPSGRKYLIGRTFAERMATQAIDRATVAATPRPEIRGLRSVREIAGLA